MSVLSFVIHILPILLLTTPTASLLTNPTTITAHVPHTTDAPLTECSSVCALMEAQIRQPAGPDQGSLFRSLCINSGRTDCDAMQTEFRVELVGKEDGFKCLCARNGVLGQEYGSTTTTTSTTTVTMTEGAPVVEEPASSGVADNEASSVSESVQSSVAVPTSISDVPISTTLIRVPLSTISSTILSTHTTLSTIRYAVSPTSKSSESTSTSTSTSKATSSSEAELNTAGEPEPSKKPKSGAIAGIVIGVLAACGIIGGGAWLIRKRQLAKIADKKFDYDY